jgi:hypothetical protein
MKNWFSRNYKTIIVLSFLIPIITVALVSISHVTLWYGISNPLTWAIYLSIGIEIAALSSLAAISADMGKKVYFPFGIVTLIQFVGNVFFAYSYIDINSSEFISWVELVAPLLEFTGIESGDVVGHRRFLAFFAGGMLPLISLSFLHMLVKFTEGNKTLKVNEIKETPIEENEVNITEPVNDVPELVVEKTQEPIIQNESEPIKEQVIDEFNDEEKSQLYDMIAERDRIKLDEEKLSKLENWINKNFNHSYGDINKTMGVDNEDNVDWESQEEYFGHEVGDEEEDGDLNDNIIEPEKIDDVQEDVIEPEVVDDEPTNEKTPDDLENNLEIEIIENTPTINEISVEEKKKT